MAGTTAQKGASTDPLLDVPDVSVRIKMGPKFVRALSKLPPPEGIPAYRLGNRLRFRAEDVDRWIEAHRATSAPGEWSPRF